VPAAVAEGLAAALLLGTLWFAVAAPKGLPEVTAAAPAAAIAVLTGLVPAGVALDEVRAVAPTVGFLAAVLVLADLCDAEGLFTAAR
jgi:arsenical pump membrane protein